MIHATPATPLALARLSDLTPLQAGFFGYLANYEGNTRTGYQNHLTVWFQWCTDNGLDPMTVERTHLAMYVRYRSEILGNKASTINSIFTPIKGFYGYLNDEGARTDNPSARVRLPKVHYEKKFPLEREELRSIRKAGKELGGRHWALAELLVVHALRISECCNITIEGFSETERGHRVLKFIRKGGRRATVPIPVAVLIALEAAAAGRTSGPLLTTRAGGPLERHSATGIFNTIMRHTKIERHINPHLVRASVLTDGFEQGLPGRDIQNLAGHLDPRTTAIYDLGLHNHDQNIVHVMAARLTA